jgi:hypothetical protein
LDLFKMIIQAGQKDLKWYIAVRRWDFV